MALRNKPKRFKKFRVVVVVSGVVRDICLVEKFIRTTNTGLLASAPFPRYDRRDVRAAPFMQLDGLSQLEDKAAGVLEAFAKRTKRTILHQVCHV